MPIQVPATAPTTMGTVILTLVRTPAFLSPSIVAGRDTPGAGSSGEAVVRQDVGHADNGEEGGDRVSGREPGVVPQGAADGGRHSRKAAASAMRVDERSGTTDTHGVRPRITIILVYIRW